MGDWIASDVNPYPSGPNPTGEPKGRLDPDAHADLVIRAIESRCEALGVDRSLLPAVALRVADIAARRGSEQRKAGRLDDARQTAACLSAFAKRLARRDPDEAGFHLLLSEAFAQESKNAWKVKDYTAIKEALRKGSGRGPHRVNARPPEHRRASDGRESPGQAGRRALRATVIAVSPQVSAIGPKSRMGRRKLKRTWKRSPMREDRLVVRGAASDWSGTIHASRAD